MVKRILSILLLKIKNYSEELKRIENSEYTMSLISTIYNVTSKNSPAKMICSVGIRQIEFSVKLVHSGHNFNSCQFDVFWTWNVMIYQKNNLFGATFWSVRYKSSLFGTYFALIWGIDLFGDSSKGEKCVCNYPSWKIDVLGL